MEISITVILVAFLPLALSQMLCPAPHPSWCVKNLGWHIGVDRVRPSGTVVHGHANTPAVNGVQGTVHGSRVIGGPYNGAQSVGGGVNFQHGNGLHGGVDATHHRGTGTTYSGNVVHGHANTPAVNGVQDTVHGSRVIGGPYNGAQSVGGGVNFQHGNGLHGGVDATHHRGSGTTYSGNVGASTKVGPGTLSVTGGASKFPGSSKVQGQVGAT